MVTSNIIRLNGLREYDSSTNTRPKLFNSNLFDVNSLHWVFCEQVEKKEKWKKKKQTQNCMS